MALTRPLSILQITDLHLFETPKHKMAGIDTEYTFCQVLDEAHQRHGKFDLILVTGDLTQDGSQPAYERIYQILETYPGRVVCLPGNHDDPVLMQQIIAGERVNCDKSVQFEGWQIINLNSKKQGSESGLLATVELDLLKQLLEVEENTNLNTLIAVHHHLLPTQSAWLDTMMIENREAFFSLVEQYPQIKAITCGHIHQEFEMIKNSLLILGAPATCFQFKPNCMNYTLDDKKPGYRIFQLFPDGSLSSEVCYVSESANELKKA